MAEAYGLVVDLPSVPFIHACQLPYDLAATGSVKRCRLEVTFGSRGNIGAAFHQTSTSIAGAP